MCISQILFSYDLYLAWSRRNILLKLKARLSTWLGTSRLLCSVLHLLDCLVLWSRWRSHGTKNSLRGVEDAGMHSRCLKILIPGLLSN